MREQIEETSLIVTLLNHHREKIARVWAEMVHSLPDSHYGERPLEELHASILRALEAIIEAISTHSYTALERYLTDVSLTRLQMGFDISEVIEALLLCKEAALPFVWESCSPGSQEACEAIVQLDECQRHMIGCFGSLYAGEMHRSLEEQRKQIAQMLTESLSLGRVTASLLEEIDLIEVLDIVCTEAQTLTGAIGSTIFLLDSERDGWLRVARSTGVASPSLEHIPIEKSLTGLAIREGKHFKSNDPASEEQSFRMRGEEELTSLLAVPLCVKGVVIGALDMVNKPRGFTQEDIRIINLFADQAAIAIENARLYQQAQELAAAQERQRLARDLHDAVTQTLFSTSLIAEVLPDIWEKDPDEGKRLLKEVRQLSRGALTEMRALLLELRPAALVEAKLSVLLRQLAEAASGRTGVPITVSVESECEIPPDVHIAIYRVAQEALNNIVKHAHASQAAINLRCKEASMKDKKSIVELNIHDDGRGFDTSCMPPDQMGLRIMRERTEAIGAKLKIKSKPGSGTRITVVWKEDKE